MRELYKLTVNDAIGDLVDEIAEDEKVSKTLARQLVINSLIYCCVREEIRGQVKFLLEDE